MLCMWPLGPREDPGDDPPLILAIARFEGLASPDHKDLQTALVYALSEATDQVPLQSLRESIGPSADAQIAADTLRVRALVHGTARHADELDAHIVFARPYWITHFDDHTWDLTAIRTRGDYIPSEELTRLGAASLDDLQRELLALIRGLAAAERAKLGLFEAEAPGVADAIQVVGEAMAPVEHFIDPITDHLTELKAGLLGAGGEPRAALELLRSRLEQRESPMVLRRAFNLIRHTSPQDLGLDPEQAQSEMVALLRRAVQFETDPLAGTDAYNLVMALPSRSRAEDDPEPDVILTRLESDPTYRRAWWISRLRGARAYGGAVHVQATQGEGAAGPQFRAAAKYYSRALRQRHRSPRIEFLGPAAPRRLPRSPVLNANAFDAHHFAGHFWRAAWHRWRAQVAVQRLFKVGTRAFSVQDWLTASFLMSQVARVGWGDEMGVDALVLGATALREMGRMEQSDEFWQQAVQIDDVRARLTRASLSPLADSLTHGLPGGVLATAQIPPDEAGH